MRRLLASGLPTISMLLTDEWYEALIHSDFTLATPDIFVAEKKLLEAIVGFRMHQGIMAVGRVPPEPSLQELIANSPSPRLFVALDGLVFAENVGVVIRNCAAFGVQGVFVGKTSASPYLRRAVRNSMGTVFNIPIIHSFDLSQTLTELRSEYDLSITIADAHTETSIHHLDCRQDLCVVFGNEDSGVSDDVRAASTHAVRIPMAQEVDSLNVASASAVVLAEVVRQRMT